MCALRQFIRRVLRPSEQKQSEQKSMPAQEMPARLPVAKATRWPVRLPWMPLPAEMTSMMPALIPLDI